MTYDEIFEARLAELRDEGRYRHFADLSRRAGGFPLALHHAAGGVEDVVAWCSNDYLAMGQHPGIIAAMHEALDRAGAGAGSGGTRHISGTTQDHVMLEAELADPHGKLAALLFTSGYVANEATLSTLQSLMPGVIVFSDALKHASMIAGIRHGVVENGSGGTTMSTTSTRCCARRRPIRRRSSPSKASIPWMAISRRWPRSSRSASGMAHSAIWTRSMPSASTAKPEPVSPSGTG